MKNEESVAETRIEVRKNSKLRNSEKYEGKLYRRRKTMIGKGVEWVALW